MTETQRTVGKGLKKRLVRCCTRHKSEFADIYGMQRLPCKDGQLLYLDRGAPILAVAHLDYVMQTAVEWSGWEIKCPQLDDRLGAWVILHLLPALGFSNYDILLTDNEERGASTARSFTTDRQYNWMFSFDRAGNDVVCYEYEDKDLLATLGDYGFSDSWGTYSDICELEDLGCKGMNFGVGYHKQHTAACYADLRETLWMADHFVTMARDLVNIHLPHVSGSGGRAFYQGFGGMHNPRDDYYRDFRDYTSSKSNHQCVECGCDLNTNWYFCPLCGDVLR